MLILYKLNSLVIDKYTKPHCFKNIHINNILNGSMILTFKLVKNIRVNIFYFFLIITLVIRQMA
ncbi:LOW QUALITY PROTEIN: hypothetical protein BC936DRAFT_140082 [Jimgerdemannia flammicorona]|uniref:Uncharacterized protein n=1 Tax=Jimgerdemannia flammicorona TaxID=994334 RepID=A0A433B2T0_9FUNG|nr:LOW QUALITY PROTEIN: hypothetical protein BC936DRAFT_140082 [Jimgerdemannia flammicorona]